VSFDIRRRFVIEHTQDKEEIESNPNSGRLRQLEHLESERASGGEPQGNGRRAFSSVNIQFENWNQTQALRSGILLHVYRKKGRQR
jgi:hypothetical protein